MNTDLRTITMNLERLQDERDIAQLFYQYGRALDYGDEEAFVDCFTADGSWRSVRRSGRETSVSGADELRAFAEGHPRAPGAFHKHIVTNIQITIEGPTASAFSYLLRMDAAPQLGQPAFVYAMGTYSDTLIKCPDGRWRFAARVADVQDMFL